MAFVPANLKMGEEFGIFRNHVWAYETTDSQATMNSANYFDGAAAKGMQIGDEVYATIWTSAVPTGGHPVPGTSAITGRIRFIVNAIAAGDPATAHIDVADGDAYTMTDSD
jgi:hypothetical protein